MYCCVAVNKLNGGGGDMGDCVDISGGVVDMSDVNIGLILIQNIMWLL